MSDGSFTSNTASSTLDVGPAEASPAISCSTLSGTLDISVLGSASDSLVVTTSGGLYQIELDDTPECQGYSDGPSGFPTVRVTGTSSPFVPTIFQPGTDTGITFVGPGSTTTLNLSAAPSGTTISLVAGTVSGLSGGGTDTFSGIGELHRFLRRRHHLRCRSDWRLELHRPGHGNVLDLSAAPSGTTISLVAGTVSGLSGGGTDTFSGIASFTGSSAGDTTLVAGPIGGLSFTGQGNGNVLNLSAAPTGTTVTLNGNSTTSPGVVADLDSGLGGSTSDLFSGIQSFSGLPLPTVTALTYTGANQVGINSASTAPATLFSAVPSCYMGQPVSFNLSVNPTNQAAGPYALGAATDSSLTGLVTGSLVKTTGWENGVRYAPAPASLARSTAPPRPRQPSWLSPRPVSSPSGVAGTHRLRAWARRASALSSPKAQKALTGAS